MRNINCLLLWFLWIIVYPIYKKIKHEDVWDNNIYIPMIWILCILGNVVNLIIAFSK